MTATTALEPLLLHFLLKLGEEEAVEKHDSFCNNDYMKKRVRSDGFLEILTKRLRDLEMEPVSERDWGLKQLQRKP